MCGVHFTSLHSTLYSSPCTSLWLPHGSETPVQNSKWSQQQVGCLDFRELGTHLFKMQNRGPVAGWPAPPNYLKTYDLSNSLPFSASITQITVTHIFLSRLTYAFPVSIYLGKNRTVAYVAPIFLTNDVCNSS